MPSRDFTDILLRRGIVSLDQLSEAERMARETNKKPADCLIQLQYATGEEVMRAMAEHHKLEYINLKETQIPENVIELVPESVARENNVLPLSEEEDSLKVIVCDPYDIDTIEKLRFILNRKIDIALAPRERISEAINKYYTQIEGESADSVLQEFTDTAIDFTETESQSQVGADDYAGGSATAARQQRAQDGLGVGREEGGGLLADAGLHRPPALQAPISAWPQTRTTLPLTPADPGLASQATVSATSSAASLSRPKGALPSFS